ncbi:MAG: glucose-6-phosphate isomerase [Trueperaceae bacterium]|nr:glucose-6-phosphate isomerase [Trueperaceae bacterium]
MAGSSERPAAGGARPGNGAGAAYTGAPARAATAWAALREHQERLRNVRVADLFAGDDGRFERFSFQAGELFVDFSKNRVTPETFALLLRLAEASGVEERKRAMFAGERVNTTEDRAVLHIALRNRSNTPMYVDGHDVMPEVNAVLAQMERFADAVRSGAWRGHTGERITDVVNIGIGGSHLGPQMVVTALGPYTTPSLRTHFVSNVDGADIAGVLEGLRPESTLFVVSSKTFTTQETMTNAHTARRWLVEGLADEDAVARHFVAVSTNLQQVAAFGIDEANAFAFWDWVGGRYSLWSAIGLSIALAVGFRRFVELLEGAHELDRHFLNAAPERNVPLLHGLLAVWYGNFLGAESWAVLPYDESLRYLPAYLQQASMESNGKDVDRSGESVAWQTGQIVWGAPGTNGQHAFYQLLHQGTKLIPADFIVPARPLHRFTDHHDILLSNFLAQTEALMRGRTREETRRSLAGQGLTGERLELLAAAKAFAGNRPTTSVLMPQLTPRALGNLIAMYEHSIFVQGVVWDVNSFDQMGVELGKELATKLLGEVRSGASEPGAHDASTAGLLAHIAQLRAS